MDFTLVFQHTDYLFRGVAITLAITFASAVIGIILGVFAGMGRISRNRIIRFIASIYVTVIRGTPVLLQIIFFYLGIPQIYRAITGTSISPSSFVTGMIALGINSGAYTAEIIRAGIQSIDKGQMEAARSVGLTYKQAMRHIILPQAFRRIIPPLTNEFIVLLKDSSLISVIGVTELMFSARILGSRYYNYTPFLLAAGLIYLSLTTIVSQFVIYLERRLAIRD